MKKVTITIFGDGDKEIIDYENFPDGGCEKTDLVIRSMMAKAGVITDEEDSDRKSEEVVSTQIEREKIKQ